MYIHMEMYIRIHIHEMQIYIQILFTLPPNEQSPFQSALKERRIKVSTKLARFSIDYHLTLDVHDGVCVCVCVCVCDRERERESVCRW